MDHPECFKDFTEFKGAFIKFIKNIKHPGTLVINEESDGIREVLLEMKDWIKEKNIRVIGYYLNHNFDFPFYAEYKGKITSFTEAGVNFDVYGSDFKESFQLSLLGAHNVLNSLGVLGAALELGVDLEILKGVFQNYKGIGRRTELVDEVNGIKVFDDYGHHPTAIASVLDTFRTTYPDKKIFAIVEPHQISRLKLFSMEFIAALNKADEAIVTKTYIGREINKNIDPIDMNSLISKVDEGKASYIEDFNDLADKISSKAKSGDIIVIFGAGNSYNLTKLIIGRLEQ